MDKTKNLIIIFSIIFINSFSNNNLFKGKVKAFPFVSLKLHIQSADSSLVKSYNKAEKLYKKEEYSKSLEITLNILSKVNQNNELKHLCNFLIGNILRKRNNHEKALIYYKRSLSNIYDSNSKELSNLNKETSLANSLLRIGTEFFELKKNDSASYYFKKILLIPSLNNKIVSIKASTYSNLSATYLKDSSIKKAKFYASKAIEMHDKNNNKISQSAATGNLASIFLEEKKYEKAKKLYLDAIDLIKKDNSITSTKYKEDLYYNLAWTLYLLKDYTAYEFQEKSYDIKDDLSGKEVQRIMKGVFEKHKIDLEKQQAVTLKNQTELIKAQQDKSTLLVSILSILGLIISGVVIYNYKLRQNNLQLKISQNKLIEEQNIDRIKSESQIKILNATIDGKETERKQIAETLHDSVSALLSSANMHLRATKKQFNGNTPVELEKTQQIILEASQKVRDLSHNLVSSILLKFGLGYAIKDIGSKYSNSELHFHTNISNISRYNQEFEIKLYNVIHELINNILKHSKASNAHIVLEDKNGFLSVLIEDDGIGFNYKDNKIKTGLGLNQIEARIQMMNGNFLIESAKEKGTKATITVPIKNKSLVTA
ncbi:ATP-binding protein [Tenacibaculum halocynthiae]|uniref:ATP-binding protein n=1 Tax=Tenacibaculum halocynthiae TaxID=1254437 RepID=UPI003895CA95